MGRLPILTEFLPFSNETQIRGMHVSNKVFR